MKARQRDSCLNIWFLWILHLHSKRLRISKNGPFVCTTRFSKFKFTYMNVRDYRLLFEYIRKWVHPNGISLVSSFILSLLSHGIGSCIIFIVYRLPHRVKCLFFIRLRRRSRLLISISNHSPQQTHKHSHTSFPHVLSVRFILHFKRFDRISYFINCEMKIKKRKFCRSALL